MAITGLAGDEEASFGVESAFTIAPLAMSQETRLYALGSGLTSGISATTLVILKFR
jgi:hypothetical protein